MSQATARPLTVRRAPRGANPTATRARLKLVQPATHTSEGGVGFVILCATLLVGGLLTVLLLNTARAQQQYTIGDLQNASSRLLAKDQELGTQLTYARAPQQVALKAQEFGMVPAGKIRYVRASDHRLVGVAEGSAATAPFTVSTLPRTPATPIAELAVNSAGKAGLVEKPKPKAAPEAKKPAPPAASTKPSDKATATPSTKPSTKPQNSPKSTGGTATKPAPQKNEKTTSPTPTSAR